jgi:hypothetical protein
MAFTYEPIATYTVTSTDTTVTFSSIPATYTDLRLIAQTYNSTANTNYMQFNGDTGSNYSWQSFGALGDTNAPFAQATTAQTRIPFIAQWAGANATYPSQAIIDINRYQIAKYKTVLVKTNFWDNGASNQSEVVRTAGVWANSTTITTITLTRTGGTWNANSIFTLYGILAA